MRYNIHSIALAFATCGFIFIAMAFIEINESNMKDKAKDACRPTDKGELTVQYIDESGVLRCETHMRLGYGQTSFGCPIKDACKGI